MSYDRDRNQFGQSAYKTLNTLLRLRKGSDLDPLKLGLRSQGFHVEGSQSHSEDLERYIGLDVSDDHGPIASMKFSGKAEGPVVSWGWSLECGTAPDQPIDYTPAEYGPNGPLIGEIGRTFQRHIETCYRRRNSSQHEQR